MVRLFRLMLFLLYIYIYINSNNIPPIIILKYICNSNSSVLVVCIFPCRAKDLSATLNYYISDTVLLPSVFMFKLSQPYNSNACYGVTSYSLGISYTATFLYGMYSPIESILLFYYLCRYL